MKTSTIRTLLWVLLFSIAFGFIETSVVVYIRELYYPEGFSFPLKMMSSNIIITELIREASTLVILLTIGIIAGRNKTEKFAYFIYSFAIWDIFYYIFLKLLLNWPESFLTWDILFLLPTTWVGPVITPIILAVLMLILSVSISFFTDKLKTIRINNFEWVMLILGSIIVIVSFTMEYSNFVSQRYKLQDFWNMNNEFLEYAIQYKPKEFPWIVYFAGLLSIISGIAAFWIRIIRQMQNKTLI